MLLKINYAMNSVISNKISTTISTLTSSFQLSASLNVNKPCIRYLSVFYTPSISVISDIIINIDPLICDPYLIISLIILL